jgi:hypothetical protein
MYSSRWLCSSCRHLHANDLACAAFPAGLPFPIVSGQLRHDHSLEGDRGVQYERRGPPDAKASAPGKPRPKARGHSDA